MADTELHVILYDVIKCHVLARKLSETFMVIHYIAVASESTQKARWTNILKPGPKFLILVLVLVCHWNFFRIFNENFGPAGTIFPENFGPVLKNLFQA